MNLNRRMFLKSSGAAVVAQLFASEPSRYKIGYTTNTAGGWEKDMFRSFREARDVGYRYVETFMHYFVKLDLYDKPQAVRQQMDDIGVRFVTISNGAPMETRFEDPSKHAQIYEDHLKLVRFIKNFGCDHLKINMGRRRPEGTSGEDLKHMADALQELGRRVNEDEGIRFGVHAHMWSQFENRHEIDYVMTHTDPKYVGFILDTGHITMAGMDPVELARKLGPRVVEFHLKDVKPENKGGAQTRLAKMDGMTDPCFFPLGSGGVDFIGLKNYLDSIRWTGFLTVELDTSPWRPPKGSAAISKKYIENTLKIKM